MDKLRLFKLFTTLVLTPVKHDENSSPTLDIKTAPSSSPLEYDPVAEDKRFPSTK